MSQALLPKYTWCDPSLVRAEHQLRSGVLRVHRVQAGQLSGTESCPGAKKDWRWAWHTNEVRVSIVTGVPRQDHSRPLIHLGRATLISWSCQAVFYRNSLVVWTRSHDWRWITLIIPWYFENWWNGWFLAPYFVCKWWIIDGSEEKVVSSLLACSKVDERKLAAALDYLSWYCWEGFKPQRLWSSWDIVSLLQELLKCTEL